MTTRRPKTGGFRRTSAVLDERIRRAGESRGFAVSRVLTHWDEIAGPEIAAICRPVRVSYHRGGLGATLTLLVSGAHAPVLAMRREALRERVNAVYGYNAISRIHITQTAPEGFAEDPPPAFAPAATPAATRAGRTGTGGGGPAPGAGTDPELARRAASAAAGIGDDELRTALERLARNVLSRAGS